MRKMKTEQGWVIEADGSMAKIRVGRHADCSSCGACASAQNMVIDALNRNESCGGHFRTEYQDAGEAKRDDANYAYVAAWEHTSVDADPVLHKEALVYENIEMQVRSYK